MTHIFHLEKMQANTMLNVDKIKYKIVTNII